VGAGLAAALDDRDDGLPGGALCQRRRGAAAGPQRPSDQRADGLFDASDGRFNIGATGEATWRRLCETIGRPDWGEQTDEILGELGYSASGRGPNLPEASAGNRASDGRVAAKLAGAAPTSQGGLPNMRSTRFPMPDVHKLILATEKSILILIAGFTVFAVGQEMLLMLQSGAVKLTDLLLLFIYAEVLGMIAAFYRSREIPITLTIFIAITALCRLIILQGKGISTVDLVYESGAVLLLAASAVAIQLRTNLSARIAKPDDDDD
jgi:protein PsiE